MGHPVSIPASRGPIILPGDVQASRQALERTLSFFQRVLRAH